MFTSCFLNGSDYENLKACKLIFDKSCTLNFTRPRSFKFGNKDAINILVTVNLFANAKMDAFLKCLHLEKVQGIFGNILRTRML